MSSNLSRRGLTNEILQRIADGTARSCGDGRAPIDAGWQGQPNATGSNFVPYTILLPATATRTSGPMDDSNADWQIPYNVWAFGVRRDQCEAIADLARNVLSDMRGETLQLSPDQKYSVQQVRTDSIGGITPYTQTDPPYWGEMDTLSVWLTKERN